MEIKWNYCNSIVDGELFFLHQYGFFIFASLAFHNFELLKEDSTLLDLNVMLVSVPEK